MRFNSIKTILLALLACASVATAARAQSCQGGASPVTINGQTCCPENLVAGPGGQGSVCPGGSSSSRLGRYSYPPFDLLPHNGPLGSLTSNPWEDLFLSGVGGQTVSGSGMHLGLYTNSSTPSADSLNGFGGASYSHQSAVSVTDALGGLAAGSLSPGYDSTSAGGGIKGVIDLSSYFGLPSNQKFILGGIFDLESNSTKFGTTTAALAPTLSSSGSVSTSTYTPTIYAGYKINETYFLLSQSVDWNYGDITNNVTAGIGNFTSFGYTTDLRIGNAFTLFRTPDYASPGPVTKGPPRTVSGYAIKLDVSGHVGYSDERSNSFTDSSGFMYGNDDLHYWVLGGTARLFTEVPYWGRVWTPYLSQGIDQRVDYQHTFTIPTQGGVAGDIYRYGEARTFWRTELGVNTSITGGVLIGVSAFYTGSADLNTVGGKIALKIPLD
jgi:hypothetical protein